MCNLLNRDAQVVVVVMTTCLSTPPHSEAPDYGGRVPVDTVPGPVPVYKALKSPISAHHRDDELPQAVRKLSVWERNEFLN